MYKHNKSMHGRMKIYINSNQICLKLCKSIVEIVSIVKLIGTF